MKLQKYVKNIHIKKVVCLENEECFDSIAEAERKYNVRHIWECCNKRTKKLEVIIRYILKILKK